MAIYLLKSLDKPFLWLYYKLIKTTKMVKLGETMVINVVRIETMLAEQCMTKTELAMKCGISRQNVSTIIRRGSCEPKTAGKLAEGLGVCISDIVSASDT